MNYSIGDVVQFKLSQMSEIFLGKIFDLTKYRIYILVPKGSIGWSDNFKYPISFWTSLQYKYFYIYRDEIIKRVDQII